MRAVVSYIGRSLGLQPESPERPSTWDLIRLPGCVRDFIAREPRHFSSLKNNRLLFDALIKAGFEEDYNRGAAFPAVYAYLGIELSCSYRVFDDGTTVVHFAALGGRCDLIRSLFRKGYSDVPDKNGASFLHYLAMGGHRTSLEEFGVAGYDLFAKDDRGECIACYAFRMGSYNIIYWLASKESKIACLMQAFIQWNSPAGCIGMDIRIKVMKILSRMSNCDRLCRLMHVHAALIFLMNAVWVCLRNKIEGVFEPDVNIDVFLFTGEERAFVLDVKESISVSIHREYDVLKTELDVMEISSEAKMCIVLDRMTEVLEVRYEWKRRLGEGVFGKVSLVEEKATRNTYAFKSARQLRYRDMFKRESEWFNFFKSVNPSGSLAFARKKETILYEGSFGLVMKAYETDLHRLIVQNPQGLPMPIIKRFTKQLLGALAKLEEYCLAHGDLTPANVLVDLGRERCAITDLGLTFDTRKPHKDALPPEDVQTLPYRAPEAMIQSLPYEKIDMWSLGCILIEMYTGKSFFDYKDPEEVIIIKQVLSIGLYLEDVWAARRKFVVLDMGSLPVPIEVFERCMRYNNQDFVTFFEETKKRCKIDESFIKPLPDRLIEVFNRKNRSGQLILLDVAEFGAFMDLIKGFLSMDPEKRLSAALAETSVLFFDLP